LKAEQRLSLFFGGNAVQAVSNNDRGKIKNLIMMFNTLN